MIGFINKESLNHHQFSSWEFPSSIKHDKASIVLALNCKRVPLVNTGKQTWKLVLVFILTGSGEVGLKCFRPDTNLD